LESREGARAGIVAKALCRGHDAVAQSGAGGSRWTWAPRRPAFAILPPPMPEPHAITQCLLRLRAGDQGAAHDMLPLVYAELRALAGHLMRGDRPDHTLRSTALVHEAWLKVTKAIDGGGGPRDRPHFLPVATKAMRQVVFWKSCGFRRAV